MGDRCWTFDFHNFPFYDFLCLLTRTLWTNFKRKHKLESTQIGKHAYWKACKYSFPSFIRVWGTTPSIKTLVNTVASLNFTLHCSRLFNFQRSSVKGQVHGLKVDSLKVGAGRGCSQAVKSYHKLIRTSPQSTLKAPIKPVTWNYSKQNSSPYEYINH